MQSAIETESSEFVRQENDNFGLKVADAVWVGTALLTRDRDAQAQFSNEEIVASVLKHRLTGAAEKSIRQHVVQHCVAEYKPQPNRSRMLHATSSTHRRLFHDWEDIYHPAREGTPTH